MRHTMIAALRMAGTFTLSSCGAVSLVFAVAAAMPLHSSDSLSMSVSPAYSFAPSTLKVRVRLEPSAENRALEIIADCPDFYRSSEITLDGEQGPATVEFNFRNVPGGDYHVVAVLKDQAGRPRASVARKVTVMATGGQG